MVNKFLYPKGGAETYLFKLGAQLVAKGHEVQYFGMDHADRCLGNEAGAYTSEVDFHESGLWERLSYPLRVIYSGEARRKMRLVLESFEPDVVHLNNFNYQLTPSIILEVVRWRRDTGRSCRIVYTAHDYNLVCPNHQLRNPGTRQDCEKCLGGGYYHCACDRCIHGSAARSLVGATEAYYWHARGVYASIDVIICCSQYLKDRLDTDASLRGRTVVLHNFVDHLERERTSAGGYVLYFGRYVEEKGFATLMDVVQMLPDVPFALAGQGPLESSIPHVDNVRNYGFMPSEELWQLIQGAAFCVCPSEWPENCPLSVMESLALGVPVIAARVGGIPELVSDGVTGELFESANKAELARRINALWSDKDRCRRYSDNCSNVSFDDAESYCDRLLRLYGQDDANV